MVSRLKRFRVQAGLTQVEVAQRVGVTQPTYQRWESGAASAPEDKLRKIANLFKTTKIKLLGTEARLKASIYDDTVPDELCHYGEVAIHFVGGGPPLLLTISEKEFTRLHKDLQGGDKFLNVQSLANQTVSFRAGAVSDLYFSSEAFDDFGPEHPEYPYHIDAQIPDPRDWEIIEVLATNDVGDDDFSEADVKRVESMVMITDEQYGRLVAEGRIKAEELETERTRNQAATDLIFEAASKIVYQLSNGRRRSLFVDREKELYNAFYRLVEHGDDLDDPFIRIEAEGRHRIVFINKSSLDYVILPSHKFEQGDVEAAAEALDD